MRVHKILYIAILWTSNYLHGQNKQLLYDFTEIPQSLMINPGEHVDFKWYAGMPGLSGISFQAGISGISVNDIFANDGLDINDKVRNRAINGLKSRDEQSATFQVELLSGGFRGKNLKRFYSFGMYIEGDVINYWPQDYAVLGFEGNADNWYRKFDLGHLKMRGELVSVFHFGINKRIKNNLIAGIRGKLYSGILDVNSTGNSGYFVTTDGQNNLVANTIQANMKMRTAGINSLGDANDANELSDYFLKKAFFGGDLGLGIDLGLTHYLNKNTVFTASLLDLGFIYHTKDVNTYSLKGGGTIEGIEVILPDALTDPNRDFWQDLVDEVEEFVPFETTHKNYISFRPTRLNASLRYDFGEELPSREECECDLGVGKGGSARRARFSNAVGGQLYMVNRPRALNRLFLHSI